MTSNLFSALEKYRGKEKRTPHEEYFTQIITYLLHSDEEIAKEFVRYIAKIKIGSPFKVVPEYFIKDIGEFDIFIEKAADTLIIIESKMGAKALKRRADSEETNILSDKEINDEKEALFKYINWINGQNYKNKIFILLTYPYEKYIPVEKKLKNCMNDSVKFRHMPWNEVHYFLKSISDKLVSNSVQSFLVKEIIKYMEDENMNAWQSINNQSNNDLFSMWKIYDQFDKTLEDISSIFKKSKLNCKQKNRGNSVVGDSGPTIYKEVKINNKDVAFGFNAQDSNEGWEFSFFIEIDEPKKGDFDKIKSKLDEYIKIESDGDYNDLEAEYILDEQFFKKDRIEQKGELEKFITKVLDKMIELKVLSCP